MRWCLKDTKQIALRVEQDTCRVSFCRSLGNCLPGAAPFLSDRGEVYAGHLRAWPIVLKQKPGFAIGISVASLTGRVKPKLERGAAAGCSPISGRTGGQLPWLKMTEIFLNYSEANCRSLSKADMAVRSELRGYQSLFSRTP